MSRRPRVPPVQGAAVAGRDFQASPKDDGLNVRRLGCLFLLAEGKQRRDMASAVPQGRMKFAGSNDLADQAIVKEPELRSEEAIQLIINAIQKLESDPDRKERMRKNAYDKVIKKFTDLEWKECT